MKAEINQLRREADERSRAFSVSAAQARARFRPQSLAQEVLSALDPEMRFMRRIESVVRGHPAIALATLLGLSWLARQALIHQHPAAPDRMRRRRGLLTVTPQQHTGDLSNGYHEPER